MANRQNKFLMKRSNVAGKIPSAGDLLLGEMALNTADVILYASGTTANSILPIGWDRISRTGDTMTGTLYAPSVSATTISATTYYGDGSNLTGISGETNTASNIGVGEEIFKQKTGVDLEFRSISGGTGITIATGDTLVISVETTTPKIKSGIVSSGSFSGNPDKATVIFTTAFSDNNYSVTVTGEDSRSWTIESKSSTGFVINSNSNTPLSNNTFWQAISVGEN